MTAPQGRHETWCESTMSCAVQHIIPPKEPCFKCTCNKEKPLRFTDKDRDELLTRVEALRRQALSIQESLHFLVGRMAELDLALKGVQNVAQRAEANQ